MVSKEAFNILESEWVEEIEEGKLGDFFEETYRVKPDAPDEIKQEFKELCELMKLVG